MTRYLGSTITAFAAFVIPFFILCPFAFVVLALTSQISLATLIFSVGCIWCSVICFIYLKQVHNQIYMWGCFSSKNVKIKTIFSKGYTINYLSCASCGIALYTHGFLNSVGTNKFFIFLSYDRFEEKYRYKMNLWKPSRTQIKVEFDTKLYNYLLTVLPGKQVKMLIHDYEKYYCQLKK